MRLGDLLHDREADAVRVIGAANVATRLEGLENPFVILFGDSLSIVGHHDLMAAVDLVNLDRDPGGRGLIRVAKAVLHRVADQVREDLIEARLIHLHDRRIRGQDQLDALLIEA